MGKDRRKRDGNKKQADSAVSSDVDSEPKAERHPRNRASQEQRLKDSSKNVDNSVRDKAFDPTVPSSQPDSKSDVPDTAELFASLKRETDEINALKANKTPRRQIISNWARYEEPLPGPDHEAELQGADFETLLKAPVSGHFQFKHERTWNANITSLSGELFSLDVDLLADGLETIPLYRKLDLPTSMFSAAELEKMDYCAKQRAVKYETTKSSLSRRQDRKGLDATACHLINILMLKEGSPVPVPKDTSDKETPLTLGFDIGQPEAKNDAAEREVVSVDTVVNSDSDTELDVKEVPGTGDKADVNKATSSQNAGSSKTTLPEVQQNVSDSEVQCDSISKEETYSEPKAPRNVISPAVTSRTEVVHPSGAVKSQITEQTVQQTDYEQNLTEHVPEPAVPVPLGQRSSRCKHRGQVQAAEVQKVNSQKSQQIDDDLDFLLSLKNPVKEAKISSFKPSQVTVSAVEDDDDTTGPNSSQFPLTTSRKQTEDLEDWLDSMLDD